MSDAMPWHQLDLAIRVTYPRRSLEIVHDEFRRLMRRYLLDT